MSIRHMKWVVGIVLAVAVLFVAIDFLTYPEKRFETLDEAVEAAGSYNLADYLFSKLVLGKDPEVILYAVSGSYAIASNHRIYYKDERGWHELNVREEASVRFSDPEDETAITAVRYYRHADKHMIVVSSWHAQKGATLADSLGSVFQKLEYKKIYAPDRVFTDFLLVTDAIPDNYELIINGEKHIKLDKTD